MGRWGHDRDDDTDGKPIRFPPSNPRRRIRVPVKREYASTARYERTLSADEIKTTIKKLIYDNPRITISELQAELKERRIKISTVTLSNIRAEYRHTVKFLSERGATGLSGT